jgi:hypothetical protein
MADELQIRVGLTLAGVEETEKKSKATVGRAQKAEKEVVRTDAIVNKVESKLKGIEKAMVRNFARYSIGQGLTAGASELIPVSDSASYAALRDLGMNTGSQSIMLKSLKGGAIIGSIISVLGLIGKAVEEIKGEVERRKKEAEDNRKLIKSIDMDLREKMQEAERVNRVDVAKIKERIYQDLRSSVR